MPPRDSAGEVCVQTDHGWLHFADAQTVLVAEDVSEVAPALAAAEAALAAGRWVAGCLAYEAAPAFDPALVAHAECPLPRVWLGVFAEPARVATPPEPEGAFELGEWAPSVDRAAYEAAIGEIKDRIAAGETYQVNHTLRLRASFAGDAYALAHRLWQAQSARHGAWLDLGRHAIASASPELFFERQGDRLLSRPMKGTAPRGLTLDDDRARAAALGASAKDRAENLMIVDMLRNDLGRIAEIGSVSVPRRFHLEKYETLWQMTSDVACRTHASLTETLAALFPCASITGAPKVATMRIIRELEPEPRGIYCGAIGYAGPGGEARFSVAIRTVHVDRELARAEFGVGGGVVWDSTAAGEWDECLTKALVLTRPRPSFDLLETLLWEPGAGYLLLERHLARLARSAEYFGYPYPVEAVERALARRAWAEDEPQRVRLRLSRGGGVLIEATPLGPPRPEPWRVALAPEPIDRGDRFLYHKTTHREVYERARAARPDVDDVILWNDDGEVTESTIANVVVSAGSLRLTPPVSSGLLAGTFRDELLERGMITESKVRLGELYRAKYLWLINSVRRWVRAELVE